MELIYIGNEVVEMIKNKIKVLQEELVELEDAALSEQQSNQEKEEVYLKELEAYESLSFFKKLFGTSPMPIFRSRFYQSRCQAKVNEIEKWETELKSIRAKSFYRFTELEIKRLTKKKVS